MTPPQWRIIRDTALLTAGIVGVVHETFYSNFDRPALLILFAAMMGLPAFLPNGRKNGNGNAK